MKPKDKSQTVVNEYDQSRLLRLYRWMRWQRTHVISLDASPQLARRKLNTLIKRSNVFLFAETQENPYEFYVEIAGERTGSGIIIGRVISEANGTATVVLRGYPACLHVVCALLTAVALSSLIFMTGIGLLRFFIALIILMIWAALFHSRNQAFNFMVNVLEPLTDQEFESELEAYDERKLKHDDAMTAFHEPPYAGKINE